MGVEIYIRFKTNSCLQKNSLKIEQRLSAYDTYVVKENNKWWLKHKESQNHQIWLSRKESAENEYYNVRYIWYDTFILLEIMSYPDSVKKTVIDFLSWLESITNVSITDEDGEAFVYK